MKTIRTSDFQPWVWATRWRGAWTALGLAAALCAASHAASEAENAPTTVASAASLTGSAGAAVVLAARRPAPDPWLQGEVVANPTRPAWDYAASTTQCGVMETDSGWQLQPMGSGVRQQILMSSARYGLTPKLDLRWGLTDRMTQSGGGTAALEGIGDQWLSARYRFYEQGRRMPAMALLYGVKAPTANPAKGFGTGFVDHQLIFIASRDLGRYHFDFNIVSTVAGGARGRDGAAQFGLVMTRPVNPKLSLILESYGGPQPGTPERFGAAFGGATYAFRPDLVFDAAYTRTYTAGSPRQQFLFGFTFASRPGFSPLPRGSSFARLMGR
jgi:hypothetical protein